jgi:hypothetical protein
MIDFKAELSLSTNYQFELPPGGFPAQRYVEAVLIPFARSLAVDCSKDVFFYHGSEYDEVNGIDRVGLQYKFYRTLNHQTSYGDLVKIFEGTVSLMRKMFRDNKIVVDFS